MKYVLIVSVILAALIAAYVLYMILLANPGVETELRDNPNGARAANERKSILTWYGRMEKQW